MSKAPVQLNPKSLLFKANYEIFAKILFLEIHKDLDEVVNIPTSETIQTAHKRIAHTFEISVANH